MSAKKTQKEVIEAFLSCHGLLYDYSKVRYISMHEKVHVICKEHGDFLVTPANHRQGRGCPSCANIKRYANRRHTLDDILKAFKEVHSITYNYDEVHYQGDGIKVKITCNKHGIFLQTPGSHKQGNGCPKCASEANNSTWSYSAWQKAGEASKNFTGFKVYIIECWNEKERFFKIGRTFVHIGKRFSTSNRFPYEYKVLKVIEGSALYICQLEAELHKLNKKYKYLPSKEFGGRQECFSKLTEETYAY